MKLIRSFGYALKGIWTALKEQLNLKIHLLAVVVVTAVGIWLQLSMLEWSIVVLTFAMVIVTEMLNTAVEYLVDFISPEYHTLAGKIKDVAAGAVLIAAGAAVVIAALIFGNKILNALI